MQPPVAIVKASAGSGKTYRLTHDYLDLLLAGDPQRYKHILAVTFTNKATEEMKSRVIAALHELSRSDDARAPKAADALRRMLHDYGCFSVSTIDKFFQTVMRAFAREIGQYASYRVELDDDAVLTQVVDRMLDS
ncbi:MAG: UvrD-helicase domain-containing protein, partial [Bacteroidales bacterium]|nr:UvrD-helicase domain-containing protein [Bacteroidales bacterium]